MNRLTQSFRAARFLLILVTGVFANGVDAQAQAMADHPIGTTPTERRVAIQLLRQKGFEIKEIYWKEQDSLELYVVDHGRPVGDLLKFSCSVLGSYNLAKTTTVYAYDHIQYTYFWKNKLLDINTCGEYAVPILPKKPQ